MGIWNSNLEIESFWAYLWQIVKNSSLVLRKRKFKKRKSNKWIKITNKTILLPFPWRQNVFVVMIV